MRCILALPFNELASGSCDKTIKIWGLKNGLCLKTLSGHDDSVSCLILLGSSSRELGSGSWDKTIKIWDTRNEKCIKTLRGHLDWVRILEKKDEKKGNEN